MSHVRVPGLAGWGWAGPVKDKGLGPPSSDWGSSEARRGDGQVPDTEALGRFVLLEAEWLEQGGGLSRGCPF